VKPRKASKQQIAALRVLRAAGGADVRLYPTPRKAIVNGNTLRGLRESGLVTLRRDTEGRARLTITTAGGLALDAAQLGAGRTVPRAPRGRSKQSSLGFAETSFALTHPEAPELPPASAAPERDPRQEEMFDADRDDQAAQGRPQIPAGMRYRATDPKTGTRLRDATPAEARRYEAINYEHRRRDMPEPALYRSFYEPVRVGAVLVDEEGIGG
jgi:hypothetical protein